MHKSILTLEQPTPFSQTAAEELKQNRAETAQVICLVDDDPSVRKSVTRLLESDGFTVRAFSKPEEFLSYMTTNSVQLAVLDVRMERMTGLELLAHRCARSPQTQVIFITGYRDPTAENIVMQAGAFAFLTKPVDDDEFLGAVHRALGHAIPGESATTKCISEPARK